MTVADSGAALFAGSAGDFVKMAPASSLTAHLTQAFRSRWGGVSDSEIQSWRNSLRALAEVVEQSNLAHSGVGVELKLPATSKRVDALFVGRGADSSPGVVLVELKQWSAAAPSPNPDNVIVGGIEHVHPSVQVGGYADYLRMSHSAFTEEGYALQACAYLHNMPATDSSSLRGAVYDGAIAQAPFFVRGEEHQLGAFLATGSGGGSGMELLGPVLHGRYRPSIQLLDGIARAAKHQRVWTLLDEQRLAYNVVLGMAERAVAAGQRGVVICTGGPGTGKSVIALHLLLTLARQRKHRVAHATGSKAFTTNLRALASQASVVFKYFNGFMVHNTEPDALDVLICDEAHRIRKSSNDRFTPAAKRSSMSQVEELLRASRVCVFFLDERQGVRPDEIGSVGVIEAAATSQGRPVTRIALDAQFRCNGCPAYVDWVSALLSGAPRPPGAWLAAGDYDLRVFDDPRSLEQAVHDKTRRGEATGRIVAGFCWPWTDPSADGSLAEDVVISDWRRPWNEKSPEQRTPARPPPKPDRHPYTLWATQPERVREVGCIYSAQGFEFDYCGVILGTDLVWRSGVGWVGSRAASHDPQIARRRLDQPALVALLQQTYRVLLTRGMRGTYLYSTDWETRQMLASLVRGQAPTA